MTIVKTEGRRVKKSERARLRKEAKKSHPQATLRDYRSSASKMRLVVDLIRGKDVQEAVRVLHFEQTQARRCSSCCVAPWRTLMSLGFDVERLMVSQALSSRGAPQPMAPVLRVERPNS